MMTSTGTRFAGLAGVLALATLLAATGQEQSAPPGGVEQAKSDQSPCEQLEVYQQFDFWLGTWTVVNAQGRSAGTNRLRKAGRGCVLLEHWQSARGPFTGDSINYYDAGKKKWVQVWADSAGQVIRTEGGLEEGAMVLTGTLTDRQGKTTPFRGKWTPLADGRVRQFFEQSSDGGRTWSTWFDGYYSRKKE